MANPIKTTRLLYDAQREFIDALDALLQPVYDAAARRLIEAGERVPPSRAALIIRDTQDDFQRVMVGQGAPLSPTGAPLSPYARALTVSVEALEMQVVQAHSAYLLARLDPLLTDWVRRAPNPTTRAPYYDPLHTWVDPRGYRLSDRIWNATLEAREKIDRYLTFHVAQGTSSQQIARDLESLLVPSRQTVRTIRPYGVDVSYDAMRLARTEITRAHTVMSVQAASDNPFVTGMDWALSARHPRVDICDKHATIGMSGQRLKAAYPVAEAPQPIRDSHPQCLCNVRPFVDDTATTIETLRERYARGDVPPMTPADPDAYLRWVRSGVRQA